mmetsp:Transcript_4067/g.10149  ORF Transcript_4067/g.10149 Transcript_4067/m.10149 type:complete len:205 (-) Transcript_4067:1096-1710(-)
MPSASVLQATMGSRPSAMPMTEGSWQKKLMMWEEKVSRMEASTACCTPTIVSAARKKRSADCASPPPSALDTRVHVAVAIDCGNMYTQPDTARQMPSTATATSALGSVPAMITLISYAHHSSMVMAAEGSPYLMYSQQPLGSTISKKEMPSSSPTMRSGLSSDTAGTAMAAAPAPATSPTSAPGTPAAPLLPAPLLLLPSLPDS